MLAVLMMVQALPGTAIAPPVPLAPTATRTLPSRAARALSVADLTSLPAVPTAVALQCLVRPDGRLGDCIDAADGGTANAALFRQRLVSRFGRLPMDPLLTAALARSVYYRVTPPRAPRGVTPTVIVREVLSAADRPTDGPPRPAAARGELVPEADPAVDIADFYPVAALRHGAMTRMTATCRVLDDRSLLCRDAKADMPGVVREKAWLAPQFDPDFARATLRVFATMRAPARLRSGANSVGQEAVLTMNWRLP